MSGMPHIIKQPLDSHEFRETLQLFRKLLSSCVGPHGGLKMVISGGGHMTVTSCSTRLLSNIVLSNPICIFIAQLIRSHHRTYNDCGLYTGIMITSMLDNVLSKQIQVPLNIYEDVIQHLTCKLNACLEMDALKMCLDFSSVKQMIKLVRSIVGSKPGCSLTKAERELLTVKVVKTFLNSIEEDVGNIIVMVTEGAFTEAIAYPGVLYRTDVDAATLHILEKLHSRGVPEISVLLFNMMLTHEENPEGIVEKEGRVNVEKFARDRFMKREILAFLKEAVEFGVGIVLCQKVVHPSIQLYLRRQGILLLERLGTELTNAVEKLSGAMPVSTVSNLNLADVVGLLGAPREVSHGNKTYVLLERKGSNVTTLCVTALTEESGMELKVVVKQAISSLHQLMATPVVVPGAGCYEMMLSAALQFQVLKEPNHCDCSPSQLRSCLLRLQMSLLCSGGLVITATSCTALDTIWCHAWVENEVHGWGTCLCGALQASSVSALGGEWCHLDTTSPALLPEIRRLPRPQPKADDMENAIVDLYTSKRSAIRLALETHASLIRIGMIVYRPQE